MANGKASSAGMRTALRRWFGSPAPAFGCEIAPRGITVARWNAGASQLSTAAWRPLAEGAVDVSPLRENLLQVEAARESLGGCLQALGMDASRAAAAGDGIDTALLIPDQAARLFVLDFDKLPRQTSEAIELVRWRLKKSVPFDIDASAISFTAHRRGSGWQVVSVVSPQAVIRQYEELLASVGLSVSRITLSSLAAMTLLPEQDAGSTLLVKMSPPAITSVIVQGEDLCLFRTAGLANGSGEAPTESILEAIYPSFAYFQDNFGRSLERVYLCGLGDAAPGVMEAIGSELHISASLLMDNSEAVPASTAGWSRAEAERYSAALAGLVRE
jgi:type IV pilus assembly protein PilM